jgi:peptide/nickel transport system substrate-binding protein
VNNPFRRVAALAAVAVVGSSVLVAAALAATAGPAKSEVSAGGTLRVGWESAFGFTAGFDPTGEYLGDAWGIYSNLLVRALVGTNHTPGTAGNKLVPDIATSVPKPTRGGLRYTFRLKSGIRFAPPVNRAVTSQDISYSLHRLGRPKNGGQYGFYYSPIRGFDAYSAGKAKSISGIRTPNARTIVIDLTAPTGDFLYRMAMPATGPIPAEVGKCFEGRANVYGRNLISTGPYMIEGSDKVDISSCSKVKPASGFDGVTKLILVRNPNYNKATDSPKARENFPDKFEFLVNANADDIYNKIEAGDYDTATSTLPPQVVRKYVTTPSLRKYFFQNSGDRTWYLPMTLTQPPFDDVHVRRALNWIMDKHGLVQAWGGPTIGKVANHIAPDALLGNQLAEFAPYKTPGDRGSLAKAKAAMRGSKYDTAKNGTCGAKECKNVLMIVDTRGADERMLPVIQASAKKIGITFTVRTVEGAYPTIQTPSNNIPITERPGWGKDYSDAFTFFSPLFDGRTIIANGNTNYSLIGITPAMAKTLKVTGNVSNIPSVNGDLDRCSRLAGGPRISCYARLDRKLMTQVVPWVPYLWSYVTRVVSKNVTKYEFDQFATTPAYAHMAVK